MKHERGDLVMPGCVVRGWTVIAVASVQGERMYHLKRGENEFARYPQDVIDDWLAQGGKE